MSDAEWIMKQQLEIKDKEIERLQTENKRLSVRNAELRDENERLRDFIEWVAKNLPTHIVITKLPNSLYDCRVYEEKRGE